jgi:serine protease Do
MKAKIISRSAVAVAVAVALSAGYVAGHQNVPAPQVITPAQAAMMPAEAAAKTGIPDFSGLVETYGPAVVNISAKHVVKTSSRRGELEGSNGSNGGRGANPQLPIDPSDPFYQFFKHFYGGMPGQGGDGGGNGPNASDTPSVSFTRKWWARTSSRMSRC